MRMAVRKKTVTSAGEEGSILSPPRCLWEREHLERRLAAPNSKRLFISNSTPSYAPGRNGTCPHEDSCVNVHSSRTETRVRRQAMVRQRGSSRQWTTTRPQKRTGILTPATAWMNLEDVVLRAAGHRGTNAA